MKLTDKSEFYTEVIDIRYLTKDWYLKCQIYPQTQGLKEELDNAVNAYRTEQEKIKIPPDLCRKLMFHDGNISKIEIGTDCTIEIESPYSEHNRIIFINAIIQQELPPVGATWLYEEIYFHKSGVGYEVQILSFKMMKPNHKKILKSDLFETKIICKDILFE